MRKREREWGWWVERGRVECGGGGVDGGRAWIALGEEEEVGLLRVELRDNVSRMQLKPGSVRAEDEEAGEDAAGLLLG